MSESSESTVVDPIFDSEPEKVQDSQPPSFLDEAAPVTSAKPRLFNRQKSIHQILGGGKHADVLLWRHKFMSAGIVFGSTIVWLLFEKSGYNLLTIVGNTMLILLVALFIWSNAAAFLNRSPPPLPELELSEEMVTSFASALREQINRSLAVAHDIALGKDFKRFLKVVVVLWGLSLVGGWFHFLTLIYILIVVAHTCPAVYERYEDHFDNYAKKALDGANKQYRKIDASVFAKFSRSPMKDKKAQ